MIRSAYFAAIADFCKQTFATQNFLMSQIFANIATLSKRKCGRVVECTGLENRRRLTPFVSSNLTASANSIHSFTSPFLAQTSLARNFRPKPLSESYSRLA